MTEADRFNPLTDRVLALAGLMQALAQVRRIADTGQAHADVVTTALDSVFRVDADTTEEVYGGTQSLHTGLMLLRDYFSGAMPDEQLPRLALAVIQLERRFVRDDDMVARVADGIRAQSEAAGRLGSSHPDVRPRVLVQGNPHYLGQAPVVAEVRAVLLSAVRSAVLWRQLGGSLWDFLLRKRAMGEAVEDLLA